MRILEARGWLAGPLLLVALLLAGCENPVGDGGEHPNGIVVLDLQTNTVVASYTHADRLRDGILTIPRGTETRFRVMLTTRGGGRIAVDGLEYSLREPTVVLGTVASARLATTDQIGVTGRVGGTTTLTLPVWHAGHHEFDAFVNLIVP